jgi:D-alanyl-D-alanine carboxypeptidase
LKRLAVFLALLLALLPCTLARAEEVPLHQLPENEERYAAYAERHPEMTWEEVLVRVNLRLDYPNYRGILYAQRPGSLSVFVNKHYRLPADYVPADLVTVAPEYSSKTVQLRAVCYDAFLRMAEEMEAAGLHPYISSGYRINSKRTTDSIWYAWQGHSEHQTGLAFDLRKRGETLPKLGDYHYEKTAEYAWLCENAQRYGFIQSYPQGATDITGFAYEPWHWRFVGIALATDMYERGFATYHEYWATELVRFAWYAEEAYSPERPPLRRIPLPRRSLPYLLV